VGNVKHEKFEGKRTTERRNGENKEGERRR
jgi:hypothetical protein